MEQMSLGPSGQQYVKLSPTGFYDHFYGLCQQAGVTPTQVSRDLGIRQSTVSMWKTQGTTPKYHTLQKLADYFGVSIDYLLGTAKEIGVTSRGGKGTTTAIVWSEETKQAFQDLSVWLDLQADALESIDVVGGAAIREIYRALAGSVAKFSIAGPQALKDAIVAQQVKMSTIEDIL